MTFRGVSWFRFCNPRETSCNRGVPRLDSEIPMNVVCESAIGAFETMRDIRLPMLRSRLRNPREVSSQVMHGRHAFPCQNPQPPKLGCLSKRRLTRVQARLHETNPTSSRPRRTERERVLPCSGTCVPVYNQSVGGMVLLSAVSGGTRRQGSSEDFDVFAERQVKFRSAIAIKQTGAREGSPIPRMRIVNRPLSLVSLVCCAPGRPTPVRPACVRAGLVGCVLR